MSEPGLFISHGLKPKPQPDHWAVEVRLNGKNLVTIESNCLSGKAEFTSEEEEVIRTAARHLRSFIGS